MMYEKGRINKIGIVAFKSGLTVIAFLIAAGLAGKFSKEIIGLDYASLTIAYIFMLGAIVPIWYGAPFGWRLAAASAGIATGVGTWLISLSVGLSDIALSSTIIGFVRTATIGVSLLVCVSILRVGRLKKGGGAAQAIPARSFPPGVGSVSWWTEMNIACLAWGSLVWDPKELPIQQRWFDDGPFAPVEFTRQSRNGRITLVLDEMAEPVRLLWAPMALADVKQAKKALKEREEITAHIWEPLIGSWRLGDDAPKLIPSLPMWAEAHGIDAVIWTALGPQYKKQGETTPTRERPTVEWVLNHLRGLTGPLRDVAEQYFRCAPPQIDTQYRRRVEATLGWVHRRCWTSRAS